MKVITHNCVSCGAVLEISADIDSGFCNYCGTPFVLERENVNSDDANVLAKAGNTFVDLGEYPSAKQKFEELANKYPSDYRGWWGLVKVRSRNFTDTDISKAQLDEIEELFVKACKVSSAAAKAQITPVYEQYRAEVAEKLRLLGTGARQEWDKINGIYMQEKARIDKEIEELNKKKSSLINPSSLLLKIVIGAVIFLTIVFIFIDGIGAILSSLFLFGVLGALVWWGGTWLLEPIYVKKQRAIDRQIRELNNQLNEAYRTAENDMRPFEEQIKKAGNI